MKNGKHIRTLGRKFASQEKERRALRGLQTEAPAKQSISAIGLVTEPPDLAAERRLAAGVK